MLSLPLQIRHTLGPLIVLLLAVVLFMAEPLSSQWLAFDRTQLDHGQWWRLLTANLLHTNLNHLLLNALGVVLLWALHGQYYRTLHYLLLVFLMCLSSTLGLYYFAPAMHWYVGLSGALHGIFMVGAYFDIRHGLKSGWLLLLGVVIKVAHEQWSGASQQMAELIGARVAIDAHLMGTIAGSIALASYWFVDSHSLRAKC
jgi:rhomboid family GlyGly-CTERM serine protease